MAEDAKPATDAAAAAPAEAAKPADATAEAPKAESDSTTAGAAPEDASAAPLDPKAEKAAQMEEKRKRFAKMTPEERAAEREARKKERDSRREETMNQRKKEFGEMADARHKARAAAKGGDASDKTMGQNAFASKANMRNKGPMDEFRGTASMFMALVEPAEPVKVSFPLSDEDRVKFSAARDGLMKSVKKQSSSMDTKTEDTKAELRKKTTDNQEKTLAILLKAVKGGMTVQEARMGMVIAQFEKLSDQEKEDAIKKATARQEKMPVGSRAKMNERLEAKNKREREALDAAKTDEEKEAYVKKIYRPRYGGAMA